MKTYTNVLESTFEVSPAKWRIVTIRSAKQGKKWTIDLRGASELII